MRSSSDRGRNLRRHAHQLPDSLTFPGSPPIVLPSSSCYMARHVTGKRARNTLLSLKAVTVGGVRYRRPVYTSRRGPLTCDAASSVEQEAQAIEMVTGKCRRNQRCSTFMGKSSLFMLFLFSFQMEYLTLFCNEYPTDATDTCNFNFFQSGTRGPGHVTLKFGVAPFWLPLNPDLIIKLNLYGDPVLMRAKNKF